MVRISNVLYWFLIFLITCGAFANTFDNDSGDFLWSNPANWQDDTLPTLTALIGIDHCILDTAVTLSGIDTRVDTELHINSGGSLTMTSGHIHPGYNSNGLVVVNDDAAITAVTATIGVLGGVNGELRIEEGGMVTTTSHTFLGSNMGGSGTVQMNGGIYDCGGQFRVGWGTPAGQVNVDGGQIQIAGTPGTTNFLLIGPGSNVDIQGGSILIEGYDFSGYVGLYDDGRLTAYDGAGVVKFIYNGVDTIIWAEVSQLDKAYDPIPNDLAENVDLNAALSWQSALGAANHNIYFGTSYDSVYRATVASDEYITNTAATSFSPDNLDYYTNYYWRVDEVAHVITKGDVWSFRTVHRPALLWANLQVFAGQWLQSDCILDKDCNVADIDGNGEVNFSDFATYTQYWPQDRSVRYVAVDGDDNNPGTFARPFATIERARYSVQQEIAAGMTKDFYIYIRGGEYYIDSPVKFDENDSGRDGYEVVYTNYPGETPVFIGGRRVTGWTLDSGNIYKTFLPDVDNGTWSFDQLFENGVGSIKARTPNTGYYHVETVDGLDDMDTFGYAAGDVDNWSDYSGGQVFIFSWEDFRSLISPIENIDSVAGTVTLEDPVPQFYFAITVDDRYFIQGIKDELDMAGEFYLDKGTGHLYYWPVSTPIEDQVIIAPALENIFEVAGSDENNRAQHIRFEGLTLCYSKFTHSFADRGRLPGAIYARPGKENRKGLMRMENTANITVKNCTLTNAGFCGISMDNYCQNNTVYGNTISHCGYYGILMAGKNPGEGVISDLSDQIKDNRDNLISNNHIHHCGRLVGNGSGIYLWQSGYNEITHNLIHNMPRYGISIQGSSAGVQALGWQTVPQTGAWELATGCNNNIKYNHIYQVIQDTEDCGAISLRDNGLDNVIENNWVHDIQGLTYDPSRGWAMAVYLDDATSNTTIRNNIFHDIRSTNDCCINVKGAYNLITNNILVSELDGRSAINYIKGGSQYDYGNLTFTKNIIYVRTDGTSGTMYDFYNATDFEETTVADSDNNIFYLEGGGTHKINKIPGPDTLTNWKTLYSNKYDQNSLTSDPLFADPANDDYSLSPGSPAFSLGFVDIDKSNIGLKTDFPRLYNPSPYDEQKDVSVNSDMNWSPTSDAVSFDIYLGTSYRSVADAGTLSTEFKGNRTSAIYDPGILNDSTVYYWRVDEHDSQGVNKGSIWKFSTK